MFGNENTYARQPAGTVDMKYEEALEKIKEGFGRRHPNIIGGRKIFSESVFADTCPFDPDLVIGYFALGTRKDALDAIDAAGKAFEGWSQTIWRERVRIMREAASILRGKKFEMAALCSFENGKNRHEAVADVDEAIDYLEYYSHVMESHGGYVCRLPNSSHDEHTRSVLKPYGVWAVISPFNFPFAITAGMTAGALITGNTVVLKPSSETPLCALHLLHAFCEAGLPEGVLNFITGPGSSVGKALVKSPGIAGIAFTGSREVGMGIWRSATERMAKPVIAEMGGKNPIIVTEKADLDKASEGVYRSAFGFGGQKCSACSRLLVQKGIKEKFLLMLIEKTRKTMMGDPTRKENFLGPVINEKARQDFVKYVSMARKDGRILCGGNIIEGKGFFVEPTIVEVPASHSLLEDELFCPILSIVTFDSLEDAMSFANKTEFGLTAGIFSEDKNEIEYFFKNIRAGVTYANRMRGGSTGALVACQPFGGWKASGTTGKGAGGEYYLLSFMRQQSQSWYD